MDPKEAMNIYLDTVRFSDDDDRISESLRLISSH